VLSWNCNHFTNEVSNFLLGKDIPNYILNQHEVLDSTPLGAMIKPMLQQASD